MKCSGVRWKSYIDRASRTTSESIRNLINQKHPKNIYYIFSFDLIWFEMTIAVLKTNSSGKIYPANISFFRIILTLLYNTHIMYC